MVFVLTLNLVHEDA